MAITFGVNVGLFRIMLANNERRCSAEDLAPLLGVEATLLGAPALTFFPLRSSSVTDEYASTLDAALGSDGVPP